MKTSHIHSFQPVGGLALGLPLVLPLALALAPLAGAATGAPGSRIAMEPAADRAAAVFTWILPGSSVPSSLWGTVERSHSAAELGLPTNTNVDALDFPHVMGGDQSTLLLSEPGFPGLPSTPCIYFTVSNSSAAQVPCSWLPNFWCHLYYSGATIFKVCKPSATSWSQPTVYRAWFELGLDQADDIDGLAINETTGTIIVSCKGNAYDQFLYIDDCDNGGTMAQPVRTSVLGTTLSQAVGTGGNDDIDAICVLDPGIQGQLYVPDDFGASVGTPLNLHPQLCPGCPVGVSASAYRRYENGVSHFDTWMVGWPPTGPGFGFALLGMTLANDPTTWVTVLLTQRNPSNPLEGDPIHFVQLIPSTHALTGLPVDFRWLTTDSSFGIWQAYPVRAFL